MKYFSQLIIRLFGKIFSRSKPEHFEKLEKNIESLSNVSLMQEEKTELKKRIMENIKHQKKTGPETSYQNLIARIAKLAMEIHPSEYFRVLLKERLMVLVQMQKRWHAQFFRPLLLRKAVAMFALMLVFAGAVFHFFVNEAPHVEAASITILEEVEGEVFIIRDAMELQGSPAFVLRADDVIRTGENSRAVIRFMDQSISRLAPDTEVKIATLFVNPLNKTETTVELVLNYGRLWSRVINLIDDFSSFQVKTKNTVAVAKKKAAFDVSVSPRGKAKVVAVQNRVDLMVAVNKKVVETTLMKGFSAEVKTSTPTAPAIRPTERDSKKDRWVADNLEQDKEYIKTIKHEAEETLKTQADGVNPFKIGLSLDEREKQMKLLDESRIKITEAQAALTQGDSSRAKNLLAEFQSQVATVSSWVSAYAVTHPTEAVELRARIDNLLNEYEKQLSLILPADNLYIVKEAVAETKVLIAESPIEKTEEKLSAATDKLFEAHDLVEQGETETAQEKLDEYRETTSSVIEDVKQLSGDDKEKAVTLLLGNQVEDLKSLKAITASPASVSESLATLPLPSNTEPPTQIPPTRALPPAVGTNPEIPLPGSSEDLKQSLEEVKKETLQNMGQTVFEAQQGAPGIDLLKKIEEVTEVDVNGKQLVNMTLTKSQVFIRSGGTVISVTPSGTTTIVPPASSSIVPPAVSTPAPGVLPAPSTTTMPPTTSSGIPGVRPLQP